MKLRIMKIIILFLLIVNSACNSQTVKYNFSQVNNLIETAINEKVFPGGVLLVYKDGIIIHHKAYGRHTYDTGAVPVTTNTIYDLASLTKVIATTTAVMICYERGLINPDNPVSSYLNDFGQNGKENITIRNLLLHNSGLPAWKKYYDKNMTPDEIIADIMQLKTESKPGSSTKYSDLGMIVLAKLVEKVSGLSFDEFCNREIFKKAGMKNTFFNPPDSLKYRIAPTEFDSYWRNQLIHGKVHDENAALLNGVAGHAGLFSTAEDISKLVRLLLRETHEEKLFSIETLKMFTERYNGRALGWDIRSESGSSAGTLFGKNSFGHTGFTGTSVWIDPDKNLAVVFLSNRVYPSRENKKIIGFRPKLHDMIVKTVYNK